MFSWPASSTKIAPWHGEVASGSPPGRLSPRPVRGTTIYGSGATWRVASKPMWRNRVAPPARRHINNGASRAGGLPLATASAATEAMTVTSSACVADTARIVNAMRVRAHGLGVSDGQSSRQSRRWSQRRRRGGLRPRLAPPRGAAGKLSPRGVHVLPPSRWRLVSGVFWLVLTPGSRAGGPDTRVSGVRGQAIRRHGRGGAARGPGLAPRWWSSAETIAPTSVPPVQADRGSTTRVPAVVEAAVRGEYLQTEGPVPSWSAHSDRTATIWKPQSAPTWTWTGDRGLAAAIGTAGNGRLWMRAAGGRAETRSRQCLAGPHPP